MEQFFSVNGAYFFISLFLASFINGILVSMGGTGFLVPFMIACGMPPALALGTARVAALGGWGLAVKKFSNAGQIRKTHLPLIILLTVVAGTIGTYLMIDLDKKYVYPVVGILLILISPLALIQKDFGLMAQEKGKKSEIAGYVLYFLVMIYGGFLGNGASAMGIFVAVMFLGYRSLEAHATMLAAWVVMSVLSSALFIYYGQVDYSFVLVLFLGTLAGGFIGSHVAIKGGDKWMKGVVCVFSFLVGVKLLVYG